MITGGKKEEKKFITVDEILARTNGGYDVYRYYLGKVSKIMSRPWGRKEKKPSWGIFPYNGIWFWKDYGKESTGTAIQFVEKFFSLSFKDACNKISFDFNLCPAREINASPVIITWDAPNIEEKEYMHIAFESQPFKSHHHKFWNIAEVTEEHCNRYECWAVKDAAINHKRVIIGSNEPVFAYYSPEEDAVKLYFPTRAKEDRFRNNINFHYLWNFNRLPQHCNKLIVQKSMKDLLVTTLLFEDCTATQAEAVKIFDTETVGKLKSKADEIFISFGSDPDGKSKSIEVTKENSWKWCNPDNKYLPAINDFYSLAAGHGLKEVEQLLKYKKIL